MIHVTSDSLEVQYPLERPWNSREKTNRNKAAVCSSPTLLQVYPGRTRHVVLSHPSVSTLPMSHSSKKLSRTSAKNHENLRAPNDTPPPHWGRTLTFSWKNWKNSPPETCSDMLNNHKTGGLGTRCCSFSKVACSGGNGWMMVEQIKN